MSSEIRVAFSATDFEHENLRCVTIASPALRGRGDVSLFLPPRCEQVRDLPLAILLHGVDASHWSWSLLGGIHRTALELIDAREIAPLAIAMPSDGLLGGGSGYVTHGSIDCERWIVDDVPQTLRAHLAPLSARSPLLLGGLSMGGFGALRLGAKYAPRFAALATHSTVTDLRQIESSIARSPLWASDVGNPEYRVITHLRRNRAALPPIRFDCGKSDRLLAANRTLHRELDECDVAHTYVELPGDHSWDYWRVHVRETLRFFDEVLRTRIR